MKVYIVYVQDYDMLRIYGIFSSVKALEAGLDELAKAETSLKQANRRRKELEEWYDSHVHWCEYHEREPFAETPWRTQDDLELAKSLFDVREIELDKIEYDPIPL